MTEEYKMKFNKLIEEIKKENDEFIKNKDFTKHVLDSKEENELQRKHAKMIKEFYKKYGK